MLLRWLAVGLLTLGLIANAGLVRAAEEGSGSVSPQTQASPESGVTGSDTRPNILLVLADDVGFTDLRSYGSEISTPHIDDLAQQGVRFTNYHTAANCAPARAMLLTGVGSHRAGVPNIPEMLAPEQRNHENYQGVLGDNVVTVASLLEGSGYHTYMAGKWHLGMTPEKLPSRRGFERTVALADSGADNWEQRTYLSLYDKANWFADGEEYELPDDFYSSRFLVDKTIEFIDSNIADEQPFFAYLPFQAVHMPVQAPQEFIDRYMGVYDEGWDVLRDRRRERALALGILPEEIDMVRMATTENWGSMDAERRRYEAKRMAVYAGMLEAMDHHLGRLFSYLKQVGQYDNTIVIFTSDNGAEASGPRNQRSFFARRGYSRLGYNADYERLGLKGSFNSISPSFASAAVSPLAFYKFYSGEGGMRVPLIVAGADLPGRGDINPAFSFVTDITPTILSFAGVSAPEGRFGGRPVEPITGRSLRSLLFKQVDRVYGPADTVGYELAGSGALFQGDYKLVRIRPDPGDNQWHLYNIVNDPGETEDLAGLYPARFQRMLSAYERYVRTNEVLPVPQGYGHLKQVAVNLLNKRLREPILVSMLGVLLVLPVFVIYRVRRAREAAGL